MIGHLSDDVPRTDNAKCSSAGKYNQYTACIDTTCKGLIGNIYICGGRLGRFRSPETDTHQLASSIILHIKGGGGGYSHLGSVRLYRGLQFLKPFIVVLIISKIVLTSFFIFNEPFIPRVPIEEISCFRF